MKNARISNTLNGVINSLCASGYLTEDQASEIRKRLALPWARPAMWNALVAHVGLEETRMSRYRFVIPADRLRSDFASTLLD